MSSISEEKTTLQEIRSCGNDGQIIVSSYTSQRGKYPELFVSQDESNMKSATTFARDGLTITNCIYRKNTVEVFYLFDDSRGAVHNEDELRQQLADHIQDKSKMIKMTKLRAKPIYKKTSISPGETVFIGSKCKIGAFVHVEGKGNHALMSGHGKSEGNVLLYPNGHQLGVVNVSLNQPPQQAVGGNWMSYTDVALAKLENQDDYTARVFSPVHGQLHLMEGPVEAEEDMEVRCFAENGKRGRVDSTAYIRHDETLNIDWRLIAIKDDADGPVHEEGESGILIYMYKDEAPDEGRVKAVGMLVEIAELPLADEGNTTRKISLAVPLTTSFEDLQQVDYCKELAIKFLH